MAQPKSGDLPPVLDLEVNGGLSQSRLVEWTQAWLDEVLARTGASGLVYASPSFWKNSLGDTAAFAGGGHRLWIAHWTSNSSPLVPASNWGGLGWSFWQWTDCTKVPGIAHCSDGDRANGPSVLPFALPAFVKGLPAPTGPPTVVGAALESVRPAVAQETQSGRLVLLCLASWATPGAGHLWLGRKSKGLVFLVALPAMFAIGIGLHGRNGSVERCRRDAVQRDLKDVAYASRFFVIVEIIRCQRVRISPCLLSR